MATRQVKKRKKRVTTRRASPMYHTDLGRMYASKIEEALETAAFRRLKGKVDLLFTSPPFPLVRKKRYGNETGEAYLAWLKGLAPRLSELLSEKGSIVLEVGNSWVSGIPAMSTLSLEALLAFKTAGKLQLCQHLICHNPARLKDEDRIGAIEVSSELRVIVSMKEVSEYEPYVVLAAAADAGVIHVIVNGLHPYYLDIDSADAIDECVKQYIYDAISEYRVSKLSARLNPDSVRKLKDSLLRVHVVTAQNLSAEQSIEIKVGQ
jgi:hypothetical protein